MRLNSRVYQGTSDSLSFAGDWIAGADPWPGLPRFIARHSFPDQVTWLRPVQPLFAGRAPPESEEQSET
jgi:hypothetical protein